MILRGPREMTAEGRCFASIILLYNGFNINNYYIHYYKNVFAHKCYY